MIRFGIVIVIVRLLFEKKRFMKVFSSRTCSLINLKKNFKIKKESDKKYEKFKIT